MMFKLCLGQLLLCISSLFLRNDNAHGYSTRNKHQYHVNKSSKEYTYSTFTYQNIIQNEILKKY